MAIVRFFFVEKHGCGCGKCGLDKGLEAFQELADALADKHDGEDLAFEAYNALNEKKFPFLKGLCAPVLAVDDTIVSSGKLPVLEDVEAEIKKRLG